MKTTWLKTTLALTISAASAQALANGIAINEQSASGAGTAYAGRASSALDASTIYGNPAGLTKLKRTEVSGGLAIVDAKDDISQAHGGSPGTNKGDSVPLASVPFGYFSTPLNDDLAVGLGIYVPYGIINDYEKSFAGRSLGSYSKVQVITVQPTIAYKINDRVSVGFGPTFNRIDGKLQNYLNTGILPPQLGGNGQDTRISIKGDDTALGYNLGVMVDLTEDTTWGLTYHSKVKYHLGGHTSISGAPNTSLSAITGLPIPGTLAQAVNGKYDAKLDITLPESVDTSITHKLDDKWTLYGGAVWTRWSRMESIEVRNSGMNSVANSMFGTIGEDLSWKDTWSASVGASYQLNPEWVLRAGYAYDPSPTDNEHRNVRIPVGDRQILTLGAGWSPTPDLTVDVAYAYLWENTAGVNQEGKSLPTAAGSVPIQPAYSAKYDNSANGLTAQVTYRF
ncbi:outer membrane protein transport protein [Pseudomonas citronellolis]|jgi:long-chain fatty acid transport protein|uniref:outer membrane protein transport protein n=1 Tax=Pseudomonas citronellolis TaxID=53408 RepID=UPI002FDB8DE7